LLKSVPPIPVLLGDRRQDSPQGVALGSRQVDPIVLGVELGMQGHPTEVTPASPSRTRDIRVKPHTTAETSPHLRLVGLNPPTAIASTYSSSGMSEATRLDHLHGPM
jgi:hypothetical protein